MFVYTVLINRYLCYPLYLKYLNVLYILKYKIILTSINYYVKSGFRSKHSIELATIKLVDIIIKDMDDI